MLYCAAKIHLFTQMFSPLIFQVKFVEKTTSSNDEVKKLLNLNLAKEGLAVYTFFQEKGRGQGSNSWESEDGKNVLISVLLEPDFLTIDEQIYLNMAVSIAITDLFSNYEIKNYSIKWPNDIFLNGKKIAGILIENTLQGKSIKNSIIGIGLNANQTIFNSSKATSLLNETGENFSIESCIQTLLGKISIRYQQLKVGMKNQLFDDYLNLLYKKNVPSYFKINNQIVLGEITGVNKNGKLEVLINRQMQYFANKEIELLS